MFKALCLSCRVFCFTCWDELSLTHAGGRVIMNCCGSVPFSWDYNQVGCSGRNLGGYGRGLVLRP